MAATKKPESDEKVRIMVPYIEGQGTELTVGVNGIFYKIRKGAYVDVPKPVAEVIVNSQTAVMMAEANQEKMRMQVQDLG